jgi:hypothetical protein
MNTIILGKNTLPVATEDPHHFKFIKDEKECTYEKSLHHGFEQPYLDDISRFKLVSDLAKPVVHNLLCQLLIVYY